VTLHSMLKRQLQKSGFKQEDIEKNSTLLLFVDKINKAYHEFDQNIYLRERSLELSSKEMRDLYEKIKSENEQLNDLISTLKEKDKLLKQQKKSIQDNANYINNIFESIPDMVFVLNSDLIIKDINKSTAQHLQLSKDQLLQRNIAEFISHSKKLEQIFSGDDHEETLNIIHFSDQLIVNKNKIPVLVSGSLLQSTSNIISSNIICIIKDITDLKKLEKENAEKMAMLTHASRLVALGEMATAIAHELNQPLSVINTNLQTLEMLFNNKVDIETNHEDITEITTSSIQQVDRAEKIITQMRKFAKKGADTEEIKKELIDLQIPIEAAISMFQAQFKLHNIKIITHFDEQCPKALATEQMIEQIIVNLITNAKNALFERSEQKDNPQYQMTLTIETKARDDKACLIISDNGIGMTEEVKNRCLEPFFTTSKVGKGTGLGITIVYNMIKNIDGDIKLNSEENEGTTFEILFQTKEVSS